VPIWAGPNAKRIVIRAAFFISGIAFGLAVFFAADVEYSVSARIGTFTAVLLGICICYVELALCFALRKFSHIDFSVEIFLIMTFYALLCCHVDVRSPGGGFYYWTFDLWIARVYMCGAAFFAAARTLIYFASVIVFGEKNNLRMSVFLIAVLAELAVFPATLSLVAPETSEPSLSALAGALIGSVNLAMCFFLKKRLRFEPFFEIFIAMAMYAAGVYLYDLYFHETMTLVLSQFVYCHIGALAFYLAARGAIKAASVIMNDLRR
jgi:hypothetical protein